MMKSRILLILVIVISVIKAGQAMEKILYIEELTTNTMNGQNAKTVKKMYYSNNNYLIADSAQPYKVLINLKNKKVSFIDDVNRRYSEMPLADFCAMAQKNSILANMKDVDQVVKETGVHKKIGSYNCTEVIVLNTKLGLKTTSYLARINFSLDYFYNFSKKAELGNQMKKLLDLQKKYKSYPALTIISPVSTLAPRGRIETELKAIELKKMSGKVFQVPAGYKKVPLY